MDRRKVVEQLQAVLADHGLGTDDNFFAEQVKIRTASFLGSSFTTMQLAELRHYIEMVLGDALVLNDAEYMTRARQARETRRTVRTIRKTLS